MDRDAVASAQREDPMKPRIKKVMGLWMCWDRRSIRVGCGWSPMAAYLDWEREC